MKNKKRIIKQDGFITRFNRETERELLFYATVAAFIAWGLSKFFQG